jgi:thiamine biosynthesis lipoprotein
MRRRKFISYALGATALGAVGAHLGSKYARSGGSFGAAQLAKLTRQGRALGTDISITAFHARRSTAELAINQAFAAIDHVEDIMSLYRPESQLSQLNRNGTLAHPDPALVAVLQRAAALSAQSDGAFDVTVQPLWSVYEEAAASHQLPSAATLSSTLARVDWRQVSVSTETLSFRQPGMAITLNGIAQGLAADAAAAALREAGVAHALIDSGEISTVGTPATKDHWAIGLKDPRNPSSLLGVTALQGRCLATSGDYEMSFAADFSQHHLLDPRTGYSPTELASVSVVAPTALEADALSTAVFLMGPEAGRALVETLPQVDALFVDKAHRVTRTTNFPRS